MDRDLDREIDRSLDTTKSDVEMRSRDVVVRVH